METTTKFIDLILEKVAECAGVKPASIKGTSRLLQVSIPRSVFVRIAREYGYTLVAIAASINRQRESVRDLYRSSLPTLAPPDQRFASIYLAACEALSHTPEPLQIIEETPPTPPQSPEKPTKPRPPKFTDWHGKLGWHFTAEECAREYYLCEYLKQNPTI